MPRRKHPFKYLLKIIQHPIILSLFYFTAMKIVMTWPAVLHMGNSVIAQIGDNIYFVWLVRWDQETLFKLRISPFFNPYLNYPDGWNLASTDITPTMITLALPGSILCGETWRYNFSMLLSFVLSGWGMYLWVRRYTNDDASGLIAGTLQELGVSYIVVDSTQYTDYSKIDTTAQSLGLVLLKISEYQFVYGFP